MKYTHAITQLRTYLKQWFLSNEPPQHFMEQKIYENVQDAVATEIIYLLGEITYHYLTNSDYRGELKNTTVFHPRLYQFLHNALQKEPYERLIEPEILVQLLTKEERDTLEIALENDKYLINGYSSIGVTRKKNQDYISAFELNNSATVLMVADGMGGGEGGEIASKLVVEHISTYLKSITIESSTIEEHLRTALFEAHQKILTYAKEHHFKSMGTTLSMTLLFSNGELYIAHVGDSRIYEMEQKGEIRQLSEDHSYPEVLFRLGKITEEEKEDYQKNIVVYILGKESLKKEEICIYKSYLYSDTDLLLCSDGFWDMITINQETFNQPFSHLKEAIFQQISQDNISVIRYQSKKNIINRNNKSEQI